MNPKRTHGLRGHMKILSQKKAEKILHNLKTTGHMDIQNIELPSVCLHLVKVLLRIKLTVTMVSVFTTFISGTSPTFIRVFLPPENTTY